MTYLHDIIHVLTHSVWLQVRSHGRWRRHVEEKARLPALTVYSEETARASMGLRWLEMCAAQPLSVLECNWVPSGCMYCALTSQDQVGL